MRACRPSGVVICHAIEQLSFLKPVCQDLYRWANDWSQKAPVSDFYCLFSLECMKIEDMIVRDGKIIAVVDLEIDMPEFLKLYLPLRLSPRWTNYSRRSAKLGLCVWVKTDEASKK
jgi:hypothetical protein